MLDPGTSEDESRGCLLSPEITARMIRSPAVLSVKLRCRHRAAGLALVHPELGRDALAELGDMADDADAATAFAQAVEDVHHLFEGFLIQAAEALVNEQRLDAGAAGLFGHHIGQAEGKGEA